METEGKTGWRKQRVLSLEKGLEATGSEEPGQESLRLFAKAHGLLSGIGYSGGRIRSISSSRTRRSQRIDIRAPGPPRLQQSYVALDDQYSDITEEPALLKRGGTAFHKAQPIEDLVKPRVSCTRTTHRAVSKTARQSRSFRDSLTFESISPEERNALNAKFRECYLQENRKVAEKVDSSFRLKEKIGVFDAKVNQTRAETTKTAELNMRIRNKVIPTLKHMREEFLSRRKTQPKAKPQRQIPHTKELQSLLEAALVDQVRLHHHIELGNSQDRDIANGHLKWLASEGIKRFVPKQKVAELMCRQKGMRRLLDNNRMRVDLAVVLSIVVCAQQPILQLVNLTDIQIAGNAPFELELSSCVMGDNITYWIDGNYSTMEGTPLSHVPPPAISQRMSLERVVPKPRFGPSNAKVGFQLDPLNPGVYFEANSVRLAAWDLTLYTYLSDTIFPTPITAFFPFATGNQTAILSISFVVPNVTFIISAFSLSLGFTLGKAGQSFTFGTQFSGAEMYMNSGQMYCYVWGLDNTGAGVFRVYHYVSQTGSIVLVNSLSGQKLQIQSFSPVSFFAVSNTGVVCDSAEGVLAFDLRSLLLSKPYVNKLWQSRDPLSYDAVLSCITDGSHVYVATETSQLVYQIHENTLGGVELPMVIEFSGEISGNAQITSVAGFRFQPISSSLSLLMETTWTTATGTASSISFRVLNSCIIGNFMIFDEWICGLVGTSCTQTPFPAFTVIETDAESFVVVFDAYAALYVYTAYVRTVCEISPSFASYIFEGVIWVSNSRFFHNVTAIPVKITAWDPASTMIYTTRNRLSSDGFSAPGNVSFTLNSMDSVAIEIYLPLSNYFSGQDLSYDVQLAPGTPQSVQITTLPMISLNATVTFPSQSPAVMTKLEFNGQMLIAVLNEDQIYLYDGYVPDATFNVLDVVPPSQSGYHITQFTCVIQLFSDVSMLVVESYTGNDQAGYDYTWDLFDISDPKHVRYENSLNFSSEKMCGKLAGKDSYLFSLRQGVIIVAEIQVCNGKYGFTYRTPITVNTLNISDFDPVEFSTEVGVDTIVVYDACLGLMNVSLLLDEGRYRYTISQISVSSEPSSVRLLSNSGFIYVLDPTNAINPLITVSSTDFHVSAIYPNFPSVTYTGLQVSYNYIALLSTVQGNQKVLVYDMQTPMIRSLVSVLPVSSGCSFSFFYTWGGIYRIYEYDGEAVTMWKLGQESPDWKPSSNLVPDSCAEHTVWSEVIFSFASLINNPFYTAEIYIIATSGINGEKKSTSVSLWLLNQGSYIALNPGYSSPSQLTSGGTIKMYDSPLTIPVPGGYFTGADTTYAFVVNGLKASPLLPTGQCEQESALVCITSKALECPECVTDPYVVVLDFDSTNDSIFFSSYDVVVREWLETGLNTTYEITEMRAADLTVCYLIETVSGAEELVVVIGEEYWGMYSGQFIMLLNTSNPEESLVTEISFRIYSVKAVFDPEVKSIKIFASDSLRVLVFTVSESTLILYSIISAQSLNVLQLSPTSIEYISDSYLLVADEYTGLFALEHTNITTTSGTYSIVQVLSGFAGWNLTGVVSLCLGPKQETLFVLSKGAALYQYSVWGEDGDLNLILKTTVFPVADDLDQYLLFDTLARDDLGNYIVFPVFDGVYCRVRVVDMSAASGSQVYTSTNQFCKRLPTQSLSTGNVQILSQSDSELILAMSLATEVGISIFQTFTILLQTQVIIYPQSSSSSIIDLITLQLIALNSLSKASAPVFTVNFTS